MGYAKRRQRYIIILGFCELQLIIRQELHSHHGPIKRIDQAGNDMVVVPISHRAFQSLKCVLCSMLMLLLFDPKLPYTVLMDAKGMAAKS